MIKTGHWIVHNVVQLNRFTITKTTVRRMFDVINSAASELKMI